MDTELFADCRNEAAVTAMLHSTTISFSPPLPCYHCGRAATVATVYRFQILPICRECATAMAAVYAHE